jgi:nucleotide-binding universal stress UspA family protein
MTKVLLAYDGSESARRALDRLVEMHQAGDEVTVISVALLQAGGPRSGGVDPVENVDKHRAELNEAKELLAAKGIQPQIVEGVGDAGDLIVKEAEKLGTGRIVVGSRGLSGPKRMLLGSVSGHVVHHAACDVLVVH